jgi:hypothetical protein
MLLYERSRDDVEECWGLCSGGFSKRESMEACESDDAGLGWLFGTWYGRREI